MNDISIHSLNRKELIQLRHDIDARLNSPVNNLASLVKGDTILGIRLSFGPHSLNEPNPPVPGEVDIVDYCEITGIEVRDYEPTSVISVSHPSEPFGLSTTIPTENMYSDHCFLSMRRFRTGYDAFFTLRPETCKEDLERLVEGKLNSLYESYAQEREIYQYKLRKFISHINTIQLP